MTDHNDAAELTRIDARIHDGYEDVYGEAQAFAECQHDLFKLLGVQERTQAKLDAANDRLRRIAELCADYPLNRDARFIVGDIAAIARGDAP